MRHVTDEEIARFLSGALAEAERQRVARHLLGSCLACRARLGLYAPALFEMAAGPAVPSPEEEAAYDEVIDRVFAKVSAAAPRWQEERRQIEEAVERLREDRNAIREMDDVPS